ncbi:MAG: hypothetical protein H0U61_07905 [Nocardioidaceae bacterium]|nr:hypothetical protein [Nocardioidaceae bacterium]
MSTEPELGRISSPALPEPAAPPDPRLPRWMWPVGVTMLTFLYALLPAIVGARSFYRRGDSASQFIPTWAHLGDLLRGGSWPPVMDPNSWHGGNYAAEALFGVYNPINAANWLFVSVLPDLDLAATLVKAEFLSLLALGLYVLCREYGAARWAASLLAVAMPFAGFTLYWDSASWASGLIAFTYMPFVWWALRRTARGALNPVWAFAVGALAITQGNPYGVLGVVIVGLAVLVESAAGRDWAAVRRLALTGLCVAAVIPLVFIPLLETAPLANRGALAGIRNNDFMSANLGDLLNLSSPSFLPAIKTFLDPMRVPTTYFAWFLLPLLPWLRWSSLRGRLAELAGAAVVSLGYFLLVVGPSSLWLFRWPVRLVEYLQLPIAVVVAVVASAGFHRGKVATRTICSGAVVVTGGYLAWSQTPQRLNTHAAATVLVGLLVVALVWALLRTRVSVVPLVAVVQAGTLLVLGFQLTLFPENASAGRWGFPSDVSKMETRFSDYTGTTLQLADLGQVRSRVAKEGPKGWASLLGGSMYHAVGVDSVNTYSGVGLKAFTRALCMDYKGGTCPAAYDKLYKPTADGRPSLAELMKLETLVVQQGIFDKVEPAPGWSIGRQTKQAVVLHPDQSYSWPNSRLSWASAGLDITSANSDGSDHETIGIGAVSESSTLVFARLGWPGYTAEIDGRQLAISRSDAGLLEVTIPAGTDAGDVEVGFRPPGQLVGLLLALLGLSGAVALGVLPGVRRRGHEKSGDASLSGDARPRRAW